MKQNFNDLVAELAKQNGASGQEVIDEMQKAIDAAYDNPDPAVRAQWEEMPFKGRPSPRELIEYLVNKIDDEGF